MASRLMLMGDHIMARRTGIGVSRHALMGDYVVVVRAGIRVPPGSLMARNGMV